MSKFTETQKGRKLIFIDELPWFDTRSSKFIQGLEHFWNSWASARSDVVLIVCGSTTLWMINKLINNKGGLNNRITKKIKLLPFNPYTITNKYAKELRNKIGTFTSETATLKSVFLMVLTTYGVQSITHAIGLVQNEIVMNDLFATQANNHY